jgi:hypothetical protein
MMQLLPPTKDPTVPDAPHEPMVPIAVFFRRRRRPSSLRRLTAAVQEERELWLAELDATCAYVYAHDAGQADEAACHAARADCFLRLRLSLLAPHG